MSTGMSHGTMLAADELLHLALAATEQDRPEDAITNLKRALELAPHDGRLYYLLGAVHAELGMYDRAIEEMTKATELAPGLTTAHFQLGLLHLTSGNVDAAETAWRVLDSLEGDSPLYLFKTGLLHLVRDEFEQCVSMLRRGIEHNDLNEALNNDMRRVITETEKAILSRADTGNATPATDPSCVKPSGKRALLSAYRGDEEADH